MDQSITAIIILIFLVICMATEVIPLAVAAICAMLAMGFSEILTFEEAFSGFSSSVIFMIIGMSMISTAFFHVGIAHKIGYTLLRFSSLSERSFVILLFFLSLCMGIVLNSMAVVTLLTPIIDSISVESQGRITRKMTYMPVAIGALTGGLATSVSASSMANASAMLAASPYGQPMSFFEPLKVSFAAILVVSLFYLTCGYRLQKKCFDFQEILPASTKNTTGLSLYTLPENTWKTYTVIAVTLFCVIGFAAGINVGAVAMLGAAVLICLRCVPMNEALKNVNWSTILVVGASIGFARGFDASGAGEKITDAILAFCDSLGLSAFGMCAALMLLATALSNLMSNNAAVTILVPISISLAQAFHADILPFVLACGLGANMSIATPICVSTMTYILNAGYRPKDYLRIGGLLNILTWAANSVALGFCFFI